VKEPRGIPSGWRRESDGSYSPPPKTAKQHNSPLVGEVDLDTSSQVGRASLHCTDSPVVTEAVRVGFKPEPSRVETGLNKTELRFLSILRVRHGNEKVRIQAITLELANNCRYSPDFSVTTPERLTFYEVKGGYIREDGWIKLKLAARLYPEFTFAMAQYKAGIWKETEIKP
jgi:hypothetical protein